MKPTATPVTKLDLMEAKYACLLTGHKARASFWKRLRDARTKQLKSEIYSHHKSSSQMELRGL